MSRQALIWFIFSIFAWAKMNKSSTNCKWVMGVKSLTNLNPLILFEMTSLSISFDRTSNARRKRNGERGSSCLNHLWGLKNPKGLPLIKIEKEAVITHYITHWIHISRKPKFANTFLRKGYSILSYTFSISILSPI